MTQTPTDALRLVPSMPTVELSDDMLFKIETGETVTWGELKRRQYEQAVRNFNTMREDGSLPAPASPLPRGGWLGVEHLSKAITRLTQVVTGDEVEAAYADFTFPGHTFRADVRAVLSALPAAPTGEPK